MKLAGRAGTGAAGWTAVCVLALAAPAGGCSFLFIKPPQAVEDFHPLEPRRCTSSSVMPALDSFATVGQVLRFGLATQLPSGDSQKAQMDRDVSLMVSGTLLAVFAASAGYGFHITNKCRKLNEQTQVWDARDGLRRRRVVPVVRRARQPGMPGGFANTGVPTPERPPEESAAPPAATNPPLPAPPPAAPVSTPTQLRSHPWGPPIAVPPLSVDVDAAVPPSSITPPAASAAPAVPVPPSPSPAPRAPQHFDQEDPAN